MSTFVHDCAGSYAKWIQTTHICRVLRGQRRLAVDQCLDNKWFVNYINDRYIIEFIPLPVAVWSSTLVQHFLLAKENVTGFFQDLAAIEFAIIATRRFWAQAIGYIGAYDSIQVAALVLLMWLWNTPCAYVILQDWWCTSLDATWRSHRPGASPVYAPAALHIVPGMGPTDAPPDQMHTWHLGIGQQLAGSAVVPCSFFSWNLGCANILLKQCMCWNPWINVFCNAIQGHPCMQAEMVWRFYDWRIFG